jgi:hypothetical protein
MPLASSWAVRQEVLRIERWTIGAEIRHGECKIVCDTDKRADKYDLMITGMHDRGGVNHLMGKIGLLRGRQPVTLVHAGFFSVDAKGAAQGHLYAFGTGSKISLAIKRRKNRAPHQGSPEQRR